MVKQYTVTVTQEADDGSDSQARAQTTVRIEVENSRAHVIELTMRALDGSDITSASLPPVDLERLAQAFGTGEPAQPVAEAQSEPAESLEPARPRRRAVRQRTSAASKAKVPGARAYRKMPDPDELQRVYQEVGSIVGVAKHYDVPTHTVQGWIGRLRKRAAVSF